jgi:MHS family proline/betaine transporter-like MFS transporter
MLPQALVLTVVVACRDSVILGSLGDAKGTAWSLRLSMALMALPTVLLGCLPSYNRVGLFAPIALALLRMLQGFTGKDTVSSSRFTRVRAPHLGLCFLIQV